jgi:hypothetical protein
VCACLGVGAIRARGRGLEYSRLWCPEAVASGRSDPGPGVVLCDGCHAIGVGLCNVAWFPFRCPYCLLKCEWRAVRCGLCESRGRFV